VKRQEPAGAGSPFIGGTLTASCCGDMEAEVSGSTTGALRLGSTRLRIALPVAFGRPGSGPCT